MAKKSVVSKLEELKELIIEAQEDAEKFEEREVNAAGGRVRKNLQLIKKGAQEIRKLITEIKNSRKKEKGGKKKAKKKKK